MPLSTRTHGHLFRLDDSLPSLVASAELKQAPEREGITGFRFYAPGEVSS
ncbi:hypothetical protein [Luteimonas deserti]|nr:hypothetical protein [Luteimonas deserti]